MKKALLAVLIVVVIIIILLPNISLFGAIWALIKGIFRIIRWVIVLVLLILVFNFLGRLFQGK